MVDTVAAAELAHGGQGSQVDISGWLLPALVFAVLGASYLGGASAYRVRRGKRWTQWRSVSWLAGTTLAAAALSPTMDAMANGARGHMIQHLLLGMLAPLCLVMGAPVSLVLGATPQSIGRRVGRLLRSRPLHDVAHPVTAAALNVGGMFVLYLTPLYAASTQHNWVHHLVHVHFLTVGYLFAWSIAGPDPSPARPGMRTRLLVLVAASAAHSYLAKVLYARAGDLPPGTAHSAADLEAAAQWMYYGGDLAEVLLAAALFATWYRHSGRHSHRRGKTATSRPASTNQVIAPQRP